MKFTKTAVAVAIAGIAALPMVASADTTLSGILELQVQGTDVDDDPTTPGVDEGNAEDKHKVGQDDDPVDWG